ncbi:MAG: class II glutamine amidotransferase [Myxococcales bacterium]|nr:class II glutamine amidotransferase [Myxococcales bacterium]
MSELLALCFDGDASPAVRFADPQAPSGGGRAPARHYGWGIGWYPKSERGASVLKDPSSSGQTAVGDALGDWERFRSTLFLCHLRGHNRPRSQQDAQPFVRSYGGHQWIFAHDGDLAHDYAERLPLGDDPAFEPLGYTDSEHAFCWLLAQLHQRRARALADVAPEDLHGWFRRLNEGGHINAILSDGDMLLVYGDVAPARRLCWSRRIPPHVQTSLESQAVSISLDAARDPNRTLLVFSSVPLSRDEWLPLAPSQMVLARRGAVVFDSAPAAETAPGAPRDPGAPPPTLRSETSHQVAAAVPLSHYSEDAHAPASAPASRVLRVVHETRYAYTDAVERSSHRLLLRPLDDRHQKLLSYDLDLSPSAEVAEFEDVFGNTAFHLEIDRPYAEFSMRATSLVRVAPFPRLEERLGATRQTIPFPWMPWQRQMLSAYLMPAELPETQLQELSEFALSFVERNDADLLGTLLDMNATIHRDFEYVTASTTIATTAFDVFESRRGVCQDFANLMICLARLLQIPARYRMGYVFTGGDYENKAQSDASHAWLELYVPRVGWHGFDPTNGRQIGNDHVRVACGRNYRDATPTSGTIYRGGGIETLTVSVRVEEAVEADMMASLR